MGRDRDIDIGGVQATYAATLVDEAGTEFYQNPVTAALTQAMEGWRSKYLAAGDHCRFCAAGAVCPMRAEQAIADAQAEFGDDGEIVTTEIARLSTADLGDLVRKARQIQHWVKAVEEHANAEALAGRIPEGFKLAAKRATRKWTDESVVISVAPIMTTLAPEEMFAEPKLLSPAQLEKKLPKAERAALAPFITKESSGANLVPEDDPRPSIRPSAEEEFGAAT